MTHLVRTTLAALLVLTLAVPGLRAQTVEKKSNTTAEQFKSGTQQIGEGAKHIGEGIKQGAIEAWEAIKAGASAAAAKFSGKPDHASAGSPGSGH